MVTGLQFLALACSREYSWQTHRLSAFVDVKDVGAPQAVSIPTNAPHPTRQQGINLLHPSPSRFLEPQSTTERNEQVRTPRSRSSAGTYELPTRYSSSILTKTSPYAGHDHAGHNPRPFDTPLAEQSRLSRDRRIIKRPDNSHTKQKYRRFTTVAEPSIWARRPDEHWPSMFNVGPAPILTVSQSRSEPLPETQVHWNSTTNHMPGSITIPSPIPTIPSEYTGDDTEGQEQRADNNRIIKDDDLQRISSSLDLEEDDDRFVLHGLLEDDFDTEEEDEYYTTASEYSEYSKYESTGRGTERYDDESFSSFGSPRRSTSPTLSSSPLPGLTAKLASPPHAGRLEGVPGADMLFAMAVERALKRGCRGGLFY